MKPSLCISPAPFRLWTYHGAPLVLNSALLFRGKYRKGRDVHKPPNSKGPTLGGSWPLLGQVPDVTDSHIEGVSGTTAPTYYRVSLDPASRLKVGLIIRDREASKPMAPLRRNRIVTPHGGMLGPKVFETQVKGLPTGSGGLDWVISINTGTLCEVRVLGV